MHDLAQFGLKDMVECGAALREVGAGASSMEEVAQRVATFFYRRLGDPATGQAQCALVRCFKTIPFESLEPDLQRYALDKLEGRSPFPGLRCLTLLGTAGDEAAWNDRRQSQRYKTIPIFGARFMAQLPMFSQLLQQFGVTVEGDPKEGIGILIDPDTTTFNVFHVMEAAGSSFIPVQDAFIRPYGIRSVLGIGGVLPSSEIFAIILFSRVTVPRETAELFKTLALSTKIAMLPFDARGDFAKVHTERRRYGAIEQTISTVEWLKALKTTQEQLLKATEEAVVVQASRIAEAMDRVSTQAAALRSIEVGTARVAGDVFFHSLASHLAGALNVRSVVVGELVGPGNARVRTLAVWHGQAFLDNVEYALAGSPCELVAANEPQFIGQDVQARFPEFPLFSTLGTEAYYGVPLKDSAGATLGVLAVLHDRPIPETRGVEQILTIFAARAGAELERKRAEEAARHMEAQLRQAQKMEAVGRLAGGIAHDFNNLLTVIAGYVEMLLQQTTVDNPVRAPIEEIGKAGARAADLTRQLLTFSRQEVLKPVTLDVNAVVTNLAEMLRRLIGEDIVLRTHLAPDLWPVMADRGQLDQVLLNVALNARDAMPNGGTLTIATSNITRETSHATDAPAGQLVGLTVADTGCGMDAATKARIFEPFFTTKPQGKGTGLGLSTVYGIVAAYKGAIDVDSVLGQGTTVSITFPRATDLPEIVLPPSPVPADLFGTETVLVVEDETAVRNYVKLVLAEKGYRVLEAIDGMDAMRVLANRNEPIHLLITDLVMPGLDGRSLAERIKKTKPDVPALFMTGYTTDEAVWAKAADLGGEVLLKPFPPTTLLRAVRDALDRSRQIGLSPSDAQA